MDCVAISNLLRPLQHRLMYGDIWHINLDTPVVDDPHQRGHHPSEVQGAQEDEGGGVRGEGGEPVKR